MPDLPGGRFLIFSRLNMQKLFRIFVELDHLREINQLLSRPRRAAALPNDGKIIREFSVECEPGVSAVISVFYSATMVWIRPSLRQDGKTILEPKPCFGFVDRTYHFVSRPEDRPSFDYKVELLAGRFSHRENKFVPIGRSKK